MKRSTKPGLFDASAPGTAGSLWKAAQNELIEPPPPSHLSLGGADYVREHPKSVLMTFVSAFEERVAEGQAKRGEVNETIVRQSTEAGNRERRRWDQNEKQGWLTEEELEAKREAERNQWLADQSRA